tara:strand:+ start:1061 stop:1315 length:255 start_codon:yes stop_codon:yes gene_type:complete
MCSLLGVWAGAIRWLTVKVMRGVWQGFSAGTTVPRIWVKMNYVAKRDDPNEQGLHWRGPSADDACSVVNLFDDNTSNIWKTQWL